MKRKLALGLCVAVLSVCTLACGTNNSTVSEESAEQLDSVDQGNVMSSLVEKTESTETENTEAKCTQELFEEEYMEIKNQIDEMNTNSDYIVGVTYLVWQDRGPDNVFSYLSAMAAVSSEDGFRSTRAYNYKEQLKNVFGCTENTLIEYCINYHDSVLFVSETNKTLLDSIKDFRVKYDDYNLSNVDVLYDYFIESSSYADFALIPDGTLIQYGSSASTYQNDINKLEKRADLY